MIDNSLVIYAAGVWNIMKRNNEKRAQELKRWREFGQDIIDTSFHGNVTIDIQELAAEATDILEDYED